LLNETRPNRKRKRSQLVKTKGEPGVASKNYKGLAKGSSGSEDGLKVESEALGSS